MLKRLRYLRDLAQRNALALLLPSDGAGLAHKLIAGVHGGRVSGGNAGDMAQRQASDRGVLACLRPTVVSTTLQVSMLTCVGGVRTDR